MQFCVVFVEPEPYYNTTPVLALMGSTSNVMFNMYGI
jgi:hypothetical protein